MQSLHSVVGEVTGSLELTQKEVDLKQEMKHREREDLEKKKTAKKPRKISKQVKTL